MRKTPAPVEVDYVLTNKSGRWKAFDVTIEGISYVLNYRDQFGPEIQTEAAWKSSSNVSTAQGANAVPAASTKS